ncbi:MAG: ABC transporter transmembrane domain-containing protein [Akkermansiaceae bacterium]|nr:ABC transporter transmembrane domain-containing protein [Akkermansiaceae bacterium]
MATPVIDAGSSIVSHPPMPSADKKSPISSHRWILTYLMREKKVFIPSLIALFLTAGLALAFPYFLKELIGNPVDGLQNSVPPAEILEKINRIVLSLVAVLFLQATIGFFRVQGFIRSGESALNRLRSDIFAHLLRLPVPYFQDQRAGSLSNRVSSDLSLVRETLINTVPQAVRQTVILIGGLVFIFISSWKLSLVMLACIPVVVLLIALFGRKVRGHSKAAQASLADASTVIEESVQNIADVKAYTNEPLENSRYATSLSEFLAVTYKGAQARGAFLSFIIFVLFGTIAFVVWYGARMYANGLINWENFFAFIIFSIFVGASLGSFPEIISQFQQTAGATERLREILDMPGERDTGTAHTLTGRIAIEDLAFTYPSRPEIPVLSGITIDLPAGQRTAIVGPSGAGKSTLFSLLLGFNDPTSGKLLFDGTDAQDISLASLRSQIAIVPQEVMLFGGTISENIAYGKPGASEEEIEAAADRANAHSFINELPEKYETLVGPRGTKLSGGQRQRIAIARAILADPKILLLDEATSALDSESERLVNEALERLMAGRTSLVIAHRLSTVRHADQILVISKGKLTERGTHDELYAANGTYKFLAETQLS